MSQIRSVFSKGELDVWIVARYHYFSRGSGQLCADDHHSLWMPLWYASSSSPLRTPFTYSSCAFINNSLIKDSRHSPLRVVPHAIFTPNVRIKRQDDDFDFAGQLTVLLITFVLIIPPMQLTNPQTTRPILEFLSIQP